MLQFAEGRLAVLCKNLRDAFAGARFDEFVGVEEIEAQLFGYEPPDVGGEAQARLAAGGDRAGPPAAVTPAAASVASPTCSSSVRACVITPPTSMTELDGKVRTRPCKSGPVGELRRPLQRLGA